MTKKTVYIVNGSDDGNLGVFGNIKAAYECAEMYLTQDGLKSTGNYPKACKVLKKSSWYTMEQVERLDQYSVTVASIEAFNLNYNCLA